MAYLDKVFKDILELPDQFFEGRYILHCGDLSTIRMQNSIKNMRYAEESAYDQYEFVIPVFQLFHTQMAHLRQVFNVISYKAQNVKHKSNTTILLVIPTTNLLRKRRRSGILLLN